MKKFLVLLSIILCSVQVVISQKVDSISVEQSGDFIKIRYKILNSTPDQIYRVKVLFSMDGGLNQEPKSITGDAGDYVVGGKPEYWVVWDVLKDVAEIKSVEFIVRAELIKDISVVEKGNKEGSHNFSLILSTQFPGPGIGLRISSLGKIGFSAQAMKGTGVIDDSNYPDNNPSLLRFSFDLAPRIANKPDFQTHLLTGITIGQAVIEDNYNGNKSYPTHYVPGLELGVIFSLKRFNFMITGSRLLAGMTEEGKAISQTRYVTIGIGYRF
jgi:hypothetical protein